jgi:hypothetical protein
MVVTPFRRNKGIRKDRRGLPPHARRKPDEVQLQTPRLVVVTSNLVPCFSTIRCFSPKQPLKARSHEYGNDRSDRAHTSAGRHDELMAAAGFLATCKLPAFAHYSPGVDVEVFSLLPT